MIIESDYIIMKELIKKRHLIPIAVWFVIYMGLFGFLEIVPPKDVHLIHCALDDRIPNMAVFIYPYVSWFPYIVVCAVLAIKNLDDRQFKKAVLVLTTGMNIFLFISYVWPTGLDFRESIVYDLHTLSGNLLKFVQTVDTPKSVFPSMHVYVTLVLQYTLEMQKKLVSCVGNMGWPGAGGIDCTVHHVYQTAFRSGCDCCNRYVRSAGTGGRENCEEINFLLLACKDSWRDNSHPHKV